MGHETLVAFRSERPIRSVGDDRLDFWPIAAALRKSLLEQPLGDGFVVGLEGTWGSGKSSVLQLALSGIASSKTGKRQILGKGRPLVVEFQPWLVGHRDALLGVFFDDLTAAIDRTYNAGSDVEDEARRIGRKASRAIQKYANAINFGAKAAPAVLTAAGHPHAAALAGTIDVKITSKAKPLQALKADVTALLRRMDRRIVVTIDDLDRLEPGEAVEILRLVRAVADFPNVVYVACFDRDVLADAVANTLHIEDGSSFLEKIFQATVTVPLPDGFDLRHWLQSELSGLIALGGQACQPDQATADRLLEVIMSAGERGLRTPRDVVRVINLFKFYWPPVAGQVDLADLVWLLLLRAQVPQFYDWVVRYVDEATQFQLGAGVAGPIREELGGRLTKLIEEQGWTTVEAFRRLGPIFPTIGVKTTPKTSEVKLDLFNIPDKMRAARFEQQRRLGAPASARRYFAFRSTKGSLTPEELAIAIDAFSDATRGGEYLKKASRTPRPQGGTMAEQLMDALARQVNLLPVGHLQPLCMAMANVLDDGERGKLQSQWGRREIWTAGQRVLDAVIQRPDVDGPKTLVQMFRDGSAVGWLADIIRIQISLRRRDPENTLLPQADMALVNEVFLKRCKLGTATPDKSPDALPVLWAWKELGGGPDAAEWVAAHTRTNQGLVGLLEKMRGWMAVNDKVFHPLDRPSIGPFLDYEQARERVKVISAGGGALAKRATELVGAFEVGDNQYREGSSSFAADAS